MFFQRNILLVNIITVTNVLTYAALCPPIKDKSIEVTCTINGENSDCNGSTNGTVATVKCAQFYESQEVNRNPFRTCKHGDWSDEIPSCTAVSGLDPTSEQMSPWNVLIYQQGFTELGPSCAGTLINEKTVLTAASCVADAAEFIEDNIKTFKMIVAAGKATEKYENPDPDPEAQYSLVLDVFIPETYSGFFGKLYSDIAVIIVRNSFNITKRIQPASVDWSNQYKNNFRYQNLSGKVAGPAKSLKYANNSTKVFEIDVLNGQKCIRFLESIESIGINNYNNYFFANDKYCAENITTTYNAPLCNNRIYQGVGLVTKLNKTYYVVGVASLGSVHNNCENNAFTLFTRIFQYISFISEKTSLYSIVKQDEPPASCGVKSVQARTLIVDGNTVAKSEYPWHVALYRIDVFEKRLICGGSLINRKVILTAANCVSNDKGAALPKKNYIIAVGKYYRKFDDPRDNSNSQFSAIKEIILPAEYKGDEQNYFGDIAILISETSFHLSRQIQPICLDWETKYEDQFLKPNVTGFVPGWGYTQENQDVSEHLNDLEVPYVDKEQCINAISKGYIVFLTSDKFCSGFLGKGKTVCKGDAGGGLVFKNWGDDRYYLVGIASSAPQGALGGCDSQQYALYTRVSKYIKNFILEAARSYEN